MEKYKKKVILLLCALCLLTGCQKPSGLTRYEAQFLTLFDTVTTIVGFAKDEKTFKEQVQKIHDELEIYHELYNIYDDFQGVANLKTVNENAGKKPVEVDKKIMDMLSLGVEMYEKTNGKVNIAYGSVLTIWHDYRTEGLDDPEHAKLPPMEELLEAEEHTDISKVILDKEASTIYLDDAEMSLDVGALGKGYATQRISEYAKEQGLTSTLISVGGNIAAVGMKDDGTKWKAGVQNPNMSSEERYVRKIELQDESLVTSGNYQRYYVVDGKEYNHIINPDTLMPAEYFASVSVLNPDSGMADAISTALYNMPLEEGKALAESLPDTEAFWIGHDGSQTFTSGFQDKIVQ